MIPIRDMKVIQIEITNACVNSCGNCSRFCGHHKKPFFMDFDCFKKSVQSLKAYTGVIGIMGGEPTLHPQFEQFVEYYNREIGLGDSHLVFTEPSGNFIDHITNVVNRYVENDWINHKSNICSRKGLWSSVNKHYAKHFELIQDVFDYQILNDHSNPSKHQPFLIRRSDLGISDDVWIELRNNCFVQRYWSASITPKGAFFCEVAAALDMLLDGPGGWPIEPGWWLRQQNDYEDQLHWCELCGASLPLPLRNASTGIDDISIWWKEKLSQLRSSKLRKGKYFVLNASSYNFDYYSTHNKPQIYLDSADERIGANTSLLRPSKIITALNVLVGTSTAQAKQFIEESMAQTPIDIVICQNTDICEICNTYNILSINCSQNDVIQYLKNKFGINSWVLLYDKHIPKKMTTNILYSLVFNPGCIYIGADDNLQVQYSFFALRASSLRTLVDFIKLYECYPSRKTFYLEKNFDSTLCIYFEKLHGQYVPALNCIDYLTGDDYISDYTIEEKPGSILNFLEQSAIINDMADYIGFFTHKNMFIFGDVPPGCMVKLDRIPLRHAVDIDANISHWRDDLICSVIRKFDMVTPIKTPIAFLPQRPETCSELFEVVFGENSVSALLQLIEIHFEEYLGAAKEFFGRDNMFHKDIFILKRNDALLYCKFASTISQLFFVNNLAEMYNQKQPGLTIFLLNIFTYHLEVSSSDLRVLSLPFTEIENTEDIILSIGELSQKDNCIHIATTVNDCIAPFFSIFIESLKQNNSHNTYKITALSLEITNEKKKDLLLQANSCGNISLTFIDINMAPGIHKKPLLEKYHIDSIGISVLPNLADKLERLLYVPANCLVVGKIELLNSVDCTDCFVVVHDKNFDQRYCHNSEHCGPLLFNLSEINRHGIGIHFSGIKSIDCSEMMRKVDAICVGRVRYFSDNTCMPYAELYGDYAANFTIPSVLYGIDSAALSHRFISSLARRSMLWNELPIQPYEHASSVNAPHVGTVIPALPEAYKFKPDTILEHYYKRFKPDIFLAWMLLKSGVFDAPYYLAMNPDVALSKIDPCLHYVRHGYKEMRNPCPWFDTEFYLSTYRDVAENTINPFYHYLRHGRFEGRRPSAYL